ncbi:MAG: nucleotidyl transferase AbiEii/AbiGii toxin family protein [Pirellulales bacterium]|nr:nucleotidyl transferase AbiEii/AbiGii toxin family protein [Pirellulales bacterium]
MDNVATMSAERRTELFRETATRRSLPVDLIEKDFWVCWSLHRLFSRMADLPATLLFKGGTSLSKVFGAIERFSEDVDLSLKREDHCQPGTRASYCRVQRTDGSLGQADVAILVASDKEPRAKNLEVAGSFVLGQDGKSAARLIPSGHEYW